MRSRSVPFILFDLFYYRRREICGPGQPYMIAVHAAYVGLQLCPLRRETRQLLT